MGQGRQSLAARFDARKLGDNQIIPDISRNLGTSTVSERISWTLFFTTVLAPFLFSPHFFQYRLCCWWSPESELPVLINLVLADMLTNIHPALPLPQNHSREDRYTFPDTVKPKTPSFYVRQIVGSSNYASGTNVIELHKAFYYFLKLYITYGWIRVCDNIKWWHRLFRATYHKKWCPVCARIRPSTLGLEQRNLANSWWHAIIRFEC